jgi:uncharacterized protein
MIGATRQLLRRCLDALLWIDDTPERKAAAFSVGVFFGFSPFIGLHTVMALGVAFLFGLNRVAAVLGVYSNLPWIIVPYYTLATILGAVVTRQRLPEGFRGRLVELSNLSFFEQSFWQHVGELLQPLLWPYTIGSLIGATALALAAYPLALALVRARGPRRP